MAATAALRILLALDVDRLGGAVAPPLALENGTSVERSKHWKRAWIFVGALTF